MVFLWFGVAPWLWKPPYHSARTWPTSHPTSSCRARRRPRCRRPQRRQRRQRPRRRRRSGLRPLPLAVLSGLYPQLSDIYIYIDVIYIYIYQLGCRSCNSIWSVKDHKCNWGYTTQMALLIGQVMIHRLRASALLHQTIYGIQIV